MSLFNKIKKFYQASSENKLQVLIFLGFAVIPIISMIVLYVVVMTFFVNTN